MAPDSGGKGRGQGGDYDWDYLVQAERVHRDLYTDPDIFALEMRRIYGGSWVYLGHESEIPGPHDFVSRRLGLRPIVLIRGKDGEVRALFNRCTHRGATICRTEQGKAEFFTCAYHGWTFDSSGNCLSVPFAEAYGDKFDRREKDLGRALRVGNYRGFVFVSLNPAAPALIDYLAAARPLLDYWIDRAPTGKVIVRSAAQRYIVRCNWKLVYDNAGDGYHPPFSHQSLLTIGARLGGARDMTYFATGHPDDTGMYAQSLGNGHTFVDQRPEMHAVSAWRRQRLQPGREAYEDQLRRKIGAEAADPLLEIATGSGMNLNIFPNLLVIGNQIQVVEPLAVDRTQITWYGTTLADVPDEINTLRMRTQEDFPIFGEIDDSANFEACQVGMAVPEMEWIDFSRHAVTGKEIVSAGGVVTGPVTDDIHMRAYYRAWKELMSGDLKLVVGGGSRP